MTLLILKLIGPINLTLLHLEFETANPFAIGFVLNPILLNTPQADLFAMNSGGVISEEILKKDALHKKNSLVTKYPNKAGYYRYDSRGRTFTTNLAKHQKLSPGNSIYHSEGSTDILAENIWRKYFHKPENYVVNGLMKYNEVICFQKEELNPICGLLVSQVINQATAKALWSHFVANPDLRLYFYDKTAREHIVRFIDNAQAIAYLQTISQKGQSASEFKTAFETAQKFQGYDQPPPSTTLLTDKGTMEKAIDSIQIHINKIIQYAAKIASNTEPITVSTIQKLGDDLNEELANLKKTWITKADFKNFSESVIKRVNEFSTNENFIFKDLNAIIETRSIIRQLLATIKKVCPQIPVKREAIEAQPTSPPPSEEAMLKLGKVNLNYNNYTKQVGRSHYYNEVSSEKNFQLYKALETKYTGAKGDNLKSRILDNLKMQINNVKNRQEFLNLKDNLLSNDNPETNVLRQAQGAFFSFFSCFGLQTTSMDALEAMLTERENDFPELKKRAS